MTNGYVGPKGGKKKRYPPKDQQRPVSPYMMARMQKYRAICKNCKKAGVEPPPMPRAPGPKEGWLFRKYMEEHFEQKDPPVPFRPGLSTTADGVYIAVDWDDVYKYMKRGGPVNPPYYLRNTAQKRVEMRERVAPLINKPMTEPVPPADPKYRYKHWSKDRDEHFFKWLTDGGLVSTWCRAANLPYHIVTYRKAKDPDFAAKYEQARSVGYDALAEEALRIADTPCNDTYTVETSLADGKTIRVVKKGDNPYARKLAVWARLELLKKWAPDKYGDKVAVDVNDTRANAIRAARARLATSMKTFTKAEQITDGEVVD